MGRVNTPPLGLQSLLGNQNFGDNPDDLSQTIRPVIDQTPFLGSTQIKYSRDASSLNGVGVAVTTTVPQGEAWYILGVSLQIPGVTNAGQFQLGIALEDLPGFTPGQQHWLASMHNRVTTNIGDLVEVSFQPAQPQLFQPLTDIVGICMQTPGGVENFTLTAAYYRLIV